MNDNYKLDLFREKAQNNKLVIFVGAGVSRNVEGMPSWSELVWAMAKEIGFSKCSKCKAKDNCTTKCPLAEELSNDEYLKIPQYLYNSDSQKYSEILKENISHDRVNAPLSDVIFNINPVHIITTNYDHLLEDSENELRAQYDVIKNDKDLLDSQKSKYIIKMHGDIDEPENIVLKEQDYLNYSQNHVLIELFVKSLLVDHTILFLGYSLSDYNVKLIISWLNYMRSQNGNVLDDNSTIGFIILDELKIEETQINYFEKNNIGVININKIPPVLGIPKELKNKKGRKLYSFLKTISEPTFDENVMFLAHHKYVSSKQLLNSLNFNKTFHELSDGTLYLSDENLYNYLVSFMNSSDVSGEKSRNLFLNAGIIRIALINKPTSHNYDIGKIAYPSLLNDRLFNLYLSNKYDELLSMIECEEIDELEKCFYLSILKGYDSIYELFENIDCSSLNLDKKIAYLHNAAILKAIQERKIGDSSKIENFINNLSSTRERKFYSNYLEIYSGNSKAKLKMNNAFNALKEAVTNKHQIAVGRPTFNDIYTLKEYAYSEYIFYFSFNLFFVEHKEDLRNFLLYYIEGMICANSEVAEMPGTLFGSKITNYKYPIDILDIDILTKFIDPKDLQGLINKYKIIGLEITSNTNSFIVNCFINLSEFVLNKLNKGIRYSSIKTLSNLAIILSLSGITDNLKSGILITVQKLFQDNDFCKFLFSREVPQWQNFVKSFSMLCVKLDIKSNMAIIKTIVFTDGFMNCLSSNLSLVREMVLSFACKDDFQEIETKVIELINNTKEFKHKVLLLHIFFRLISNNDFKRKMTELLIDHFEELDGVDIFEFMDGDWIRFTSENLNQVFNDVLSIAEKKSNWLHSIPDPLEESLFKIYILYLEGVIDDISSLDTIADDNEHLQFLLSPNNFDYSKVDFTNYMWKNFVRYDKTRSYLIAHKDVIVKYLKEKLSNGTITESEKEILYRFFLPDDDNLLN